MFRSSVKGTGYPLHSPVSSSLPHPCVTVCHHISTGIYQPHKLPTPMENVGDTNEDRNEIRHLIRIKKSLNHSVPPVILNSFSFSLSTDVSFFHYLCFISFRVSNQVGRAPNWDSYSISVRLLLFLWQAKTFTHLPHAVGLHYNPLDGVWDIQTQTGVTPSEQLSSLSIKIKSPLNPTLETRILPAN